MLSYFRMHLWVHLKVYKNIQDWSLKEEKVLNLPIKSIKMYLLPVYQYYNDISIVNLNCFRSSVKEPDAPKEVKATFYSRCKLELLQE